MLFSFLSKLHDKYQRDITFEEFSLYVLFNCQEKDKENLQNILLGLQEIDGSSDIIEDLMVDAKNKQSAYQLALAALEASEGRKPFDDLLLLTKQFNSEDFALVEEDVFVTHNLHELYEDGQSKQGLRWRLKALNNSLGSLRKGNFGFLFARPETGKTTFLASEVSHFAQQAKGMGLGPVLWFNNEQEGKEVSLRIMQAALGLTLTDLYSDREKHNDLYEDMIGDHILLVDSAAIHRRFVEKLCEQHQPSLVLFDQLDKVKGFSGDLRDDLRLGEIYIWARELAKAYCPVIGVSQSDASGEGKKWLNMDNVANAKTAKQAEADWILGIGRTHDTVDEYTRYFCISKNKLLGDMDTDPTQRHGKFAVRILPEIARYGDIE